MKSRLQKLWHIYSRPLNWVITLFIIFVIFTAIVMINNYAFIQTILASDNLSWVSKLKAVLISYQSLNATISMFSVVSITSLCILFGVQTMVIISVFNERRKSFPLRGGALGIFGMISGLFGAGCAACGSIFLGSIFASGATLAVLSWLPFGGEELGVVGMIVILFSLWKLLGFYKSPMTC